MHVLARFVTAPLTPARLLMDRLAFAWKFAALALVLLVPMTWIGWQYTQVQNANIDFNAKELLGTQYIRPATLLVDAIGDARAAAIARAAKHPDAAAKQAAASQELEAAWDALAPVDRRYGDDLATTKLRDALKVETERLSGATFASPRLALDAWNRAADDAIALVLQAGNESNLILDPDLDTYYLMDSHVVRLVTVADLIGRANDLRAVDALEHGTTGVVARDIAYGRLLGSIEFNAGTIADNYVTSRANTTDKGAWDRTLETPVASYAASFAKLEQLLGAALQGKAVDTRAVDASVTAVRDEVLDLQAATTDRLEALTEERVGRYESARNTALLALLAGALLAALLFGGLYVSLRRALGAILRASDAIGRGELRDELTVDTRDEVGRIARSFRTMTASLRDKAAAASRIAEGDVHADVSVLGPQDELGTAFQRMVEYLQQTADVVEELARGNVDVAAGACSDRDVLGTALADTVQYLREMSQSAGVEFAELAAHITEQAQIANRIADGDLSGTITPRSDEDVLGVAFQRMTDNLREIIGELSVNAESVSAASEELSATSRDVTSDMELATTQVAELEIGAGAQQQILRQVADRTAGASDANDVVVDRSRAGREAIIGATSAMDALGRLTTEVTDTMRTLERHGQEIETIIEAITSISDQTNLLALNAAIEAARAGDAGRGFAVVADEVRKLAEESQTAAQSVADLVLAMQRETNRAVDLFEHTAGEATQSAQLVNTAREAFEQIDAAVVEATERVRAIATDAAEAARVAEQARATTQDVGNITGQTMASMEEVASSSEELATLAERLTQTTARFRTSSAPMQGLPRNATVHELDAAA